MPGKIEFDGLKTWAEGREPYRDMDVGKPASFPIILHKGAGSGRAAGVLKIWPDREEDDSKRRAEAVSFAFSYDQQKVMIEPGVFNLLLRTLREAMSAGGLLEGLKLGSMTPYPFLGHPDLRIVVASTALKDTPKALPYTLGHIQRDIPGHIVMQPNQEIEESSKEKEGGSRIDLFDLTNLSTLDYVIRIDCLSKVSCICYDHSSRFEGCHFYLDSFDKLKDGEAPTCIFLSTGVWADGLFIAEERPSPLFSSFKEVVSAPSDVEELEGYDPPVRVIPLRLNFINTFLVRQTLDSLSEAVEGRVLDTILLNQDDEPVLKEYLRGGGKALADKVIFDDDKPIQWDDLFDGATPEALKAEIENMPPEPAVQKKPATLEEMMANRKRKARR